MSKLEPWMVEYLRGHVGTLEYAGVELLKIAAAISAELERGDLDQRDRDHRAMERLRKGSGGCVLSALDGWWLFYPNPDSDDEHVFSASDPAEAINAAEEE